jgi:hypothetical protein
MAARSLAQGAARVACGALAYLFALTMVGFTLLRAAGLGQGWNSMARHDIKPLPNPVSVSN